jgi:plastocyanin
VKLAASANAIAYDTKQLSAKAGQVTIGFTNPSAVTHDVCLEDPSGQQVGCSSTISQSNTTLSENLSSGKYTFFCSVDGHRLAGMEGTLSVK